MNYKYPFQEIPSDSPWNVGQTITIPSDPPAVLFNFEAPFKDPITDNVKRHGVLASEIVGIEQAWVERIKSKTENEIIEVVGIYLKNGTHFIAVGNYEEVYKAWAMSLGFDMSVVERFNQDEVIK